MKKTYLRNGNERSGLISIFSVDVCSNSGEVCFTGSICSLLCDFSGKISVKKHVLR